MNCLNCGKECSGNFCPDCGQSTKTKRITWASFSLKSFTDFFKCGGAFINTSVNLLYRPWKVITDYIDGKRVRYTSPVLYLFTIVFYIALLNNIFPQDADADQNTENLISIVFDYNLGLFMFYILIPISFADKVVYRNQGVRKFSMPEMLVAWIYILSMTNLIDAISMPFVAVFSPIGSVASIYILCLMLLTIFKIHEIHPYYKRVMYLLLFCIMVSVFFILFFLITEGSYMLFFK